MKGMWFALWFHYWQHYKNMFISPSKLMEPTLLGHCLHAWTSQCVVAFHHNIGALALELLPVLNTYKCGRVSPLPCIFPLLMMLHCMYEHCPCKSSIPILTMCWCSRLERVWRWAWIHLAIGLWFVDDRPPWPIRSTSLLFPVCCGSFWVEACQWSSLLPPSCNGFATPQGIQAPIQIPAKPPTSFPMKIAMDIDDISLASSSQWLSLRYQHVC